MGVSPTYDLYHLTLAEQEEEVSGFIVKETDDTVTLRVEGGVVADFAKDWIIERRKSAVSAMPEDLQEQVTVDELVEHLSRLR